MKLTSEQISFYNENGFLQVPDLFNDRDVSKLYDELPQTIERDSPRIIYESDGSVRSVFAPHFVSTVYNRLARLERLVLPSEQLIGHQLYVHQFKINSKKALKGDWWEWHQDFPYWHIDDGIERPELVSAMIYLQDTDSTNGALMLIPKSHKMGIAEFSAKDSATLLTDMKYNDHHNSGEYLSSLNANLKFTIHHELIKKLASTNGIITAEGKKGSVLFFDANVFHASNNNLSPFDRDAILITYNSVSNVPRNIGRRRPDFLACRDYRPIVEMDQSL